MSLNIKHVLILITGLLISINSHSQSFGMEWATTSGGSDTEKASRMVKDSDGSVITIGTFQGTATFGSTSLSSNGVDDIFIHKVDSNGTFLWAQQIGGSAYDDAYGICLTSTNDILISGGFQSTVDFDPQSGIHSLTSNGSWDIFVLKLNTNGVFQWVKQIGGTGDETSNCIVTNNLGEIILGGGFRAAVDFNSGTGVNIETPLGGADIFTLKLNSLGDFMWVNTQGGTDEESISELEVDTLGNIYSVGSFSGTVSFNSGTNSFSSAGFTDLFIQKMSSNGTSVWAKTIGGVSHDYANAIGLDGNGNLVCVGIFSDTVDFNPGAGVNNLIDSIFGDAFILKLGLNGDFKWAKQNRAKNRCVPTAVYIDDNDNIYSTGFFDDSTDFDPGIGEHYINSLNFFGNAFVQKLDSSGGLTWVHALTNYGPVEARDVLVDQQERVCLLGNYAGTLDVDPSSSVFNISCVGGNNNDVFLLSFKECSTNTSTDVISSCGSYTWRNGTTYTSNNNSDSIVLTNATGCDSLIYLDLTILSLDITILQSRDTISSAQSGAVYQWIDCGTNTLIVGATSQSFVPTTPGTYKVAIDLAGCMDTSLCYQYIECNVSANFQFTDLGNGAYSFTNNSSGSFSQIYWSFGDGGTSSLNLPTHSYQANGNYVVVLTINDSLPTSTCRSYFMDTISVIGLSSSLICQAGFSVYYDSVNSAVSVVNSSVGSNLSYSWDFGDGANSTSQLPSHSYATNGPFNLCLTIDDGNGCTDTYCDSISNQGVWFRGAGFNLEVEGPDPTSISKIDLSNNLRIYPNPVYDNVSIEITNWSTNTANIVVRDMIGKTIITKSVVLGSSKETISINTSKWASGTYVMEISDGEHRITEKIVVH